MIRSILVLSITLCLSVPATAQDGDAQPGAKRQSELIYLLRQDCGACHGMRLRGGLGPALNAERFKEWSVDRLTQTILYGRPGTPMPPWRPFLSDSDARWLAGQLKQGLQQ